MRYKILYLILMAYPIIALLPRHQTTPNLIWGAAGFFIVLIDFFFKIKNSSFLSTNIFLKVGFILVLIMSLSVMLSGDTNFNKWNNILKFTLPLFLASMLYSQIPKLNLIKLYKISMVYTVGIFMFLIYRIIISGTNITNAMENRGVLWYDKAYGIAITYTTILLLFIFLSNLLGKNKYWKYVLFIPIYYLTSRTTIIGMSLFIVFQIFIDFKSLHGYLILFLSIMLFVLSYFGNPSFKSSVNATVITLLTSEKDAVQGNKKFSEESFSSGRSTIYDYYFNSITYRNVFTGNGMYYLNIKKEFGLRLHNDFLEFFFSFGIFGFLVFLIGVGYRIFYLPIKRFSGKMKLFFIGFFLYFISMSVFTSIMDYQNTVYLYLLILLSHKIYYESIKNNLQQISL